MGLQIGIVGLPNAGKSTLFNSLTGAGAAVASYPFTTINPNRGVVAVQDPRLERVRSIAGSAEAVPAAVEFVDIAGLVEGAHRGEGLGNQFLGHIRAVDAIALVLRAFRDPDVAHTSPDIDPLHDLATLDLELILADLAVIDRRIEKVQTQAKAQPREFAEELSLLRQVWEHLNGSHLCSSLSPTEKERAWLAPVNLLTAKPRLLVVNTGEEDLPTGGPPADAVRQAASAQGAEYVVVCAQCEAELADWPPEDAAAYRAELGLAGSGRSALIEAGFRLLHLISFFTATGAREVRSWPIPAGTRAIDAAGHIHSDMARGFIRAEVVPFAELDHAGSFTAARDRGILRLEGRDYIVEDGDVVHFRFNV